MRTLTSLSLISIVLFSLTVSAATSRPSCTTQPLTVRVQNTTGGPQIHVNGTPIPPRFFWGSENSGRMPVGTTWSEQSFEFTPDTDTDKNGTLHFRFAEEPCQVWITDLRLFDVQSGADVFPAGSFASMHSFAETWSTWPLGEYNTVGKTTVENGMLQVTLTAPPAAGKWPDYHLHSRCNLTFAKSRTFRCTFRVKASVKTHIVPVVYQVSHGVHTRIGGPIGSFYNQIALARDAGVNLISFAAPTCWAPPEQGEGWTALDALCRRIIAINPNVLLVPRFAANAPGWWLDRHPEAQMVYDGSTRIAVSCVSDRAYRADISAHLEKLARHLCETFPQNFAGLHPCGQNTGEWFYYDSWKHPLSGYDPATRAAFRDWLKRHGATDAATAEPPSAEARRAHTEGFLRDPARESRLIDFARFQQEEMADHVLALASACRRGSGGKKLVVFFYGYAFEFPPLGNGAPTSGHYAMGRILSQGRADIDILCSPISYTDRDWLGTAPVMSAAESVNRAGILWLNEDDSRTFLDPRKQEHVQEGGLVDLQQTQQVMLRNTAQASLRGFGTWWMDLPGQGWFNDAAIWQQIVRLHPVDIAMARRDAPFTPDIAAIVDEDSMCHLTGGSSAAARPLIYEGRAALGRSGVPYGQYLLSDVLGGKVSARMQVFLAAWRLTPEQRQTLAAQREAGLWKTLTGWFGFGAGITRVWCWAPGYLYPERADVAGMSELTGFAAKKINLPTTRATPTETGRQNGLLQAWGPLAKIDPLFTVEASPEEVWATFADGSPAVAVRRSTSGIDVFVGVPQLTPELVHALAKRTGVHCYTQPGPALWAANGYLSVQAQTNAPVVLDTGRTGPVTDALDGSVLGKGPRVELPMKQGDVRVLRY